MYAREAMGTRSSPKLVSDGVEMSPTEIVSATLDTATLSHVRQSDSSGGRRTVPAGPVHETTGVHCTEPSPGD